MSDRLLLRAEPTRWIVYVVAWGLLACRIIPGWWRNSMWLDEGYTRVAIDNFWGTSPYERWTMALYFRVMSIWGQIDLAAWWLRLPSLVATLGTFVVVIRLAGRIRGRDAALVVAPLLAVSPMVVAKAIEARPYAIEMFVVTLCWLCAIRLTDAVTDGGDRRRWVLVLTTCALVGPGAHLLFVIQFIPIVLFCLTCRHRAQILRSIAPATIGVLAATAILLSRNSGTMGWLSPITPLEGMSAGYFSGWPIVAAVLFAVAVVGALDLVRRAGARDDPAALVPLWWILLPVLALLYIRQERHAYDPRYLAPIAPAVALLVATGSVVIAKAARARLNGVTHRQAWAVAVAGVLVVASVGGPRPASEMLEDWNGAVREIADDVRPGDAIYMEYKPLGQYFRVPFEVAWQKVPGTPVLPSVTEPRALDGHLRRFDERFDQVQIDRRVIEFRRIWMVSYRGSSQMRADRTAAFARTFRLASTSHFTGDIEVRLFVRRDDP